MQNTELMLCHPAGTGRRKSQAETADTQGAEDDEDGEEDATEQVLAVVWVHPQRKKGKGA